MSWELIGCSRHQVESYPLRRVGLSALIDGGDDDIGLCDAIYSGRLPIPIYTIGRMPRAIEATTDDIMVLDVARITICLQWENN